MTNEELVNNVAQIMFYTTTPWWSEWAYISSIEQENYRTMARAALDEVAINLNIQQLVFQSGHDAYEFDNDLDFAEDLVRDWLSPDLVRDR